MVIDITKMLHCLTMVIDDRYRLFVGQLFAPGTDFPLAKKTIRTLALLLKPVLLFLLLQLFECTQRESFSHLGKIIV